MSPRDVDLVNSWFRDGSLIHPYTSGKTIIDVAREAAETPAETETHVALVLLDGFGLNLLDRVLTSSDSFLRRHFRHAVNSVFPATTAAALASIGSGTPPGEHGILGWTLRDVTSRVIFNPLPWINETTKAPLGPEDADPSRVFGFSSVLGASRLQPRFSLSAHPGSHFSRAMCRGMDLKRVSPDDLSESLAELERLWRSNPKGSFSYVYCNQPDKSEHQLGPEAPEVSEIVKKLDSQLSQFWQDTEDLKKRKIIVIADHGQFLGEEILPRIETCQISMEPISPAFFVNPDVSKIEAETELRQKLPGWAILTPDEVVELGILGPSPISANARAQLGDFLGINNRKEFIGPLNIRGLHGGLHAEEMRVPLIIAEN
jgi:predicted AlkP superfamily pyrophosphatase or phosphodiesterase